MAIPHAVLAEGWIPFTVVIVLTFLFSWFYVRYYQDHSQSEVSSTLTAIVALFVALLTSALVPVDVFLVSYMKNPDGTWKDWSSNQVDRDDLEDSAVATAYYVLYALVVLLIFLLIPFMYFYFEEKDEDVTVRQRMCSAMFYTAGFLIVAVVLLLVGAFAPLKKPPRNTTAWESKLEFLKDQLEASNGETALSLLIGFLSFLGMLVMITYTAYGMTAMPFSMIKGFKSAKNEQEGVSARREQNQEQARMIRTRYMDGREVSDHDRRQLSQLEGDEHVLVRRERHLESAQLRWISKCLKCCRPFQVLFGVFFLLFALLVFVSLFITCVDKALHSLGYKYGYALPKPQLPNPINIIMVQAQKVFPLDYILFVAMVLYFVYSSMAGIKRISIRCCCIKLYKIRPRRTLPQALLFLCVLFMLIVLSLNIMLFTLAPQYVMYGSQHYMQKTAHFSGNNTTSHNSTFLGGNGTVPTNNTTTFSYETKVCSTSASSDQCTMSRIAVFLNRFFYKVWFFGACYYWGTWLFLAVFMIGLGVSLIKKRRSVVEEELDSSDDESDEKLLST